MSDKKHIDDLFKEQLQHFEATPSPKVWSNIQSKMKKEKEDRKVIPLWWRVGGVAALLALLLTVGNMVFDPFGGVGSDPLLVDEDTERSVEDKEDTNPVPEQDIKNEAISSEGNTDLQEKGVTPEDPAPTDPQENHLQKSRSAQEAVAVEEQKKSTSPVSENPLLKKDVIVNKSYTTTKDAVTVSEHKDKQEVKGNDTFIEKQDANSPIKNALETGVAVEDEEQKRELPKIEEERFHNPLLDKEPSKVLPKDTETAVTQTDEKKDEIQENPELNKKSIFDAIAEEDQQTEDITVDDKDSRAWEVTPNFGPVFYNSLGSGSSIDPMFADNSQSGDTNFSYGVQVSYAVSDRLSIRSGVNNVNLGYTTGDVELATGPVASALASIDYGGRTNVLTALDKGTLANSATEGMNPFDDLSPKSTGGNAELSQNLSYYEIPLELNYALLNKRFGINMIGGFSTLLLGDNEIVANDGNFQEVLGEANNLNSVSFSTNIGLGFNYKISKRLKFNIEPMFKYQLNPYSDSSVDFRPYYLGVYSGLSFKF